MLADKPPAGVGQQVGGGGLQVALHHLDHLVIDVLQGAAEIITAAVHTVLLTQARAGRE